jgi:hypothetical protein
MPQVDEPFKVTQPFGRRALGFLWNKRESLDPGQVELLNAIYKNKKQGKIDCEQEVTYSLKKTSGAFGRFYGTKGSLETLEKEIRGTLCHGIYRDIDIVNCHPVLCVQFAQRYFGIHMEHLTYYVNNRDTVLAWFPTREAGKEALIKVLYGGLPSDSLSDEIHGFAKHVMSYPPFAELLSKCRDKIHNDAKKQQGGSKKSLTGMFLSLLLQTEERRCVKAMMANARSQGLKPAVYAYDGFQVVIGKVTLNLQEMETAVANATGYKVSIAEKPMPAFEDYLNTINSDDDTEIASGVTKGEYLAMKADFETGHFYFAPTNQIVEVLPSGELLWMEFKHAKEYLGASWYFRISEKHGDIVKFLDLWLKDTDRRVIHRIDMKPAPGDPSVFSPPLRFAYKRNTDEIDDEMRNSIECAFRDFINALVPDEAIRIALVQWLAQIIQDPFNNSLMAVILSGGKGCGKDTLGDFLSEWVIGKAYSQNYDSTEQYWDKYDCGRMNKLFIKIEEAKGSLNVAHADAMKTRITSHNAIFNPKGGKAIDCANYNRSFMTTNEGNPVEMTEDQRRYMVVSCGRSLVGKTEYWSAFRKLMFNPIGGRVIGELLESVTDVGEWPRVPPRSTLADMMIEEQKSSEERFAGVWDGEELPMTDLYKAYKSYCVENDLPYALTSKSLGMKLTELVRDGVIQRKKTKSGVVYYK